MALKDPPSYVGLDPALIYGVHDLNPELYGRLLQLIGWMWVTRKTGSPLGTSAWELADRWGIAERTAYRTLQILAEKGYIELEYRNGQARIRKGERCSLYNTPGEPATQPQQVAGGDTQHAGGAGTDDNRSREATYNTPGEPAIEQESRAVARHGATPRHDTRHEPNSSSVVVVGSDLDDKSQPQLQLTNKSAVQLALEAAGVFEDKAADLAPDPWVTEERIGRWLAQLEDDPTVRSVPAVLYSNLRAHREPPPLRRQEKDRKRFVEGAFAAYVQH